MSDHAAGALLLTDNLCRQDLAFAAFLEQRDNLLIEGGDAADTKILEAYYGLLATLDRLHSELVRALALAAVTKRSRCSRQRLS